jgi:hypothetical protein
LNLGIGGWMQEPFHHLRAEDGFSLITKNISILEDGDAPESDKRQALAGLVIIAEERRHTFYCKVGTEFECDCGLQKATDYLNS